MTIYYTHDNGGRPFKVNIQKRKNIVTVYQYNQQIYKYNPLKIFIGKSELDEMTEYSGGYGPRFDGNSILLQIGEDYYIYIGESIKSFITISPIIEYKSPVGNNDVPYPYAVDKIGQVYLITENVILKNNPIIQNPYLYYNEHYHITPNLSRIPLEQVPDFEEIDTFYVGNRRYTMTYKQDSEKEYRRLSDKIGMLSILYKNGEKKILSCEDYVGIIERFGKLKEFIRLETKSIIERDQLNF